MKREKPEINQKIENGIAQNLIDKIDKTFLVLCYAITVPTWILLIGGIVLTKVDMKMQLPYFILLLMFTISFLFQLLHKDYKEPFFYGHYEQPTWFVLTYLIGLFVSFGTVFLPKWCFFIMPFAVLLILFSTPSIGLLAFFQLALFHITLAGANEMVLYGYLILGLLAVALFGKYDLNEVIHIRFFLYHLYGFVTLFCALCIENRMVSVWTLIQAMIHSILSAVVLFLGVNLAMKFVLLKEKEQFQELNDPENALLVELKESSVESYFHAVHTAYFCEKLALVIGADALLAKAGGYYHKIGKMRGQSNLKNTLLIAKEYEFPAKLVQVLTEYGNKNTLIESKEAAIVLISDTMVSTVSFLFEQDRNAELDYEQITDLVFQRHIESGILDSCGLSLKEISQIKKYFVEDTVYYDFLR